MGVRPGGRWRGPPLRLGHPRLEGLAPVAVRHAVGPGLLCVSGVKVAAAVGEPVGGRMAGGDDDPAGRAQHAGEFGQGADAVLDVVEDEREQDGVEGGVGGSGEGFVEVVLPDFDVRAAAGAGVADHVGALVDAHRVGAAGRELGEVEAGAAAGVEDVLPSYVAEEFEDGGPVVMGGVGARRPRGRRCRLTRRTGRQLVARVPPDSAGTVGAGELSPLRWPRGGSSRSRRVRSGPRPAVNVAWRPRTACSYRYGATGRPPTTRASIRSSNSRNHSRYAFAPVLGGPPLVDGGPGTGEGRGAALVGAGDGAGAG